MDLRRDDKRVALSDVCIYNIWKIDKSRKETINLKCQELPDGYYSVSDLQDYFEYLIKEHETLPKKSQIQMYVKKTQNRITFKTKSGCNLEVLMPEIMTYLEVVKEE